MCANKLSPLRFNFGFMLEANIGTIRDIELDYPSMRLADDVFLRPLRGGFRATRTSKGIYVQGLLTAGIEVACTRCLTEDWQEFELELDEVFQFGSYPPEGEYAIPDTGILDLAPLVRELSVLALPMQVLCRDACLGLCAVCGQNRNESDCDCVQDEIDPRLAALRGLLPAAPDEPAV